MHTALCFCLRNTLNSMKTRLLFRFTVDTLSFDFCHISFVSPLFSQKSKQRKFFNIYTESTRILTSGMSGGTYLRTWNREKLPWIPLTVFLVHTDMLYNWKNELEKKKRQCRKMYLRKEGGKIKAGQERKRHQSLDYVTCKFYKA